MTAYLKSVLPFLLILLQFPAWTQNWNLADKAYDLGPRDHMMADCSFHFECDCCENNIYFEGKSTFYHFAHCEGEIVVKKGSYIVKNSTLFLNFDRVAIRRVPYDTVITWDNRTEKYSLFHSLVDQPAMVYQLSNCEDGGTKIVGVNETEIGVENKSKKKFLLDIIYFERAKNLFSYREVKEKWNYEPLQQYTKSNEKQILQAVRQVLDTHFLQVSEMGMVDFVPGEIKGGKTLTAADNAFKIFTYASENCEGTCAGVTYSIAQMPSGKFVDIPLNYVTNIDKADSNTYLFTHYYWKGGSYGLGTKVVSLYKLENEQFTLVPLEADTSLSSQLLSNHFVDGQFAVTSFWKEDVTLEVKYEKNRRKLFYTYGVMPDRHPSLNPEVMGNIKETIWPRRDDVVYVYGLIDIASDGTVSGVFEKYATAGQVKLPQAEEALKGMTLPNKN